jgi:hypothetical protein
MFEQTTLINFADSTWFDDFIKSTRFTVLTYILLTQTSQNKKVYDRKSSLSDERSEEFRTFSLALRLD